MVATRGRTFKRPWRRSCLSSKLKSSSAPIGRKDSWCFHAVGSSNAPLLGSTAAEGLPRIGRTSIATRWRSCGLPQSASCSENFVIPPDVFGQTLKQVITKAARMGILQQPANPAHSLFIKEVEPIAGVLGLTYRILQVRGLEEFEPSFASMRAWPADAVFVLDDATFIASRAAMAAAAARHRLPLICGAREMAEAGCLFSYSASIKDMWYRSASFVDKIIKGAKPADLPVQQGTKFEFVVNLKTARALGFDVPPTLVARADEVIE